MAKKSTKPSEKTKPSPAVTPTQEEDEKEYYEYKIGDRFYGEEIGDIYYARRTHFIYQPVGSNGVAYASSDPQGKLSSITRCMVAFSKKISRPIDKKKFVYKLATVMHLAYEGKEEDAKKMCDELINEIKEYAENLRNGRVIYLITLIVSLIFSWIGAIAWGLFPLGDKLGDTEGLVGAALFGLSGGFFSIVTGINKIDFYYENSKLVFAITSLSRVMISMLAGVVLYVMIKSNLALGFLADSTDTNAYVVLVFATLAGFSESFIPNILKTIEKNTKDDRGTVP